MKFVIQVRLALNHINIRLKLPKYCNKTENTLITSRQGLEKFTVKCHDNAITKSDIAQRDLWVRKIWLAHHRCKDDCTTTCGSVQHDLCLWFDYKFRLEKVSSNQEQYLLDWMKIHSIAINLLHENDM